MADTKARVLQNVVKAREALEKARKEYDAALRAAREICEVAMTRKKEQ